MYHHFKGNGLNRSEYIQRWVVHKLLRSKVPNSRRESSIEWELKHSSSVLQLARLLAEKRGLDIELAEIIAVLHDVAVIETGRYVEHGPRGAVIAGKLLRRLKFKPTEMKLICNAIAHHSEKQAYSPDAYVELAKDADVLDCSWYGRPKNYWRLMSEKPIAIRKHYMRRMMRIRAELGLPKIIPEGMR